MEIAVLGMGRMGRALATRLLDTGHAVTVWNRTPGRAGEVVDRGGREAASAEAAAGGAEAVVTVLTDDTAVAGVLLGGPSAQTSASSAGAGPAIGGDAGVVDCSTVSPATTRSLAAAYGERFAACPILGAPAAVAAGEAAVVVAGPASLLDRLDPLWSSMSGSVRRAGDDPGAAVVLKLLGNYLLMSGIAAVSEAAVAGAAAGVTDDVLVDFLSGASAPNLRNRVADVVAGEHDGWFPTPMGAKDVHLFVDLGRSVGVGLPLASLVAARYDEAAAAGFADRDIAAVVELLRRSG